MQFVNPSVFFGLLAISIPIIVHLFNFRKFKRLYFTNVKFLKEVKQESQAKSKLKHLFVLLCRILAVNFLVLAFAQPYIPAKTGKMVVGEKNVSIYVDNSFSMGAGSRSGMLLDEAKKRAKEIAEGYGAGDRFQVLTNDFEGRHQRMVSREEFYQLVDEIKTSASVKSISEIYSRQRDILNSVKTGAKKVYMLSDFQKTTTDITELKNDTTINSYLIPVIASSVSNVFIDSCWFESPVRQVNIADKLFVRIKNISDKNIEGNSIKLFINEAQRSPAAFNVEARSKTETTLSFTIKETGIQRGKAEITDYPVTFDDVFYFSFDVLKNISVLNIVSSEFTGLEEKQAFINSLYGKDSLFLLTETDEKKIDYSVFKNQNLIVLNDLKSIPSGLASELKRFITSGGSLAVFPGTAVDQESYKQFLSSLNANYYERSDTVNSKVDRINYEHIVFTDVFEQRKENMDMPVIYQHYLLTKNTRSNEEAIMSLQNGDVFFCRYTFGKGSLWLSAVPLSATFSNLPKHAIFVPLMYRVAVLSRPAKKLFYTIGKNEAMEVTETQGADENVYHIQNKDGSFDIIPDAKNTGAGTFIYLQEQKSDAGNYFLAKANIKLSGLSLNYDRKESDLNCFAPEELTKQLETNKLGNFSLVKLNAKIASETLQEIDQGKKLWKLCIILVLIFLAAEILLLRFWKN